MGLGVPWNIWDLGLGAGDYLSYKFPSMHNFLRT